MPSALPAGRVCSSLCAAGCITLFWEVFSGRLMASNKSLICSEFALQPLLELWRSQNALVSTTVLSCSMADGYKSTLQVPVAYSLCSLVLPCRLLPGLPTRLLEHRVWEKQALPLAPCAESGGRHTLLLLIPR